MIHLLLSPQAIQYMAKLKFDEGISCTSHLSSHVNVILTTENDASLYDTPVPKILIVPMHEKKWFSMAADYITIDELSTETVTRALWRTVIHSNHTQTLQIQANTDALTQLLNRRALNNLVVNKTVIFIDLDDFKAYNDTQGHHAGDVLLKNLGEILKTSTRTVDSCFRMGGDEFLCQIDANLTVGIQCAERIQLKIQALGITASMGVIYVDTEQMDTLLPQIDAALYTTKRNGKNAITIVKS